MPINAKRYREGLLTVDHRAGIGLPLETTQAMGLPPMPNGKVMESATKKCAHCGLIIVLNPDRTRPRHFCPKCDNYICDTCEGVRVAAGYVCSDYERMVDGLLNTAVKDEIKVRQRL